MTPDTTTRTVAAINRNTVVDFGMLAGIVSLVVISLNAKASIELRLDRLEQTQSQSVAERWSASDMSGWVKDVVILNPGWRAPDPRSGVLLQAPREGN
jgi:hypothetical protein